MRRGNGEGSIFKLSGKRRKPYAVRITTGYTDDGKQKYKYLGYYAKRTEAKTALREYLADPYDLNMKNITIIEIFEKWRKQTDLAETTVRSYISAFNQVKQLHNMNIRDIKAIHLEGVMEDMKPHMKSVFKNAMSHVYKYGMKHEMVDKNIMDLISVRSQTETKEKTPFTLEEMDKLKSFKHPLNDTVFILLYSGLRISELLDIETKNVHLDERYMIGGTKTAAGKDRIIPIHDEIFDLIKARYNDGGKYLIMKNGRKVQYATYRNTYWNPMNELFGFTHTPHDTRHTFTSFADKCGINRVALKRILGHALSDITDHYTHKDVCELLHEVNKLEYK